MSTPQLLPGFHPATEAFNLPGDPVNAAVCIALAFLIKLKTVAIARESIGSPAGSLFLVHFLIP